MADVGEEEWSPVPSQLTWEPNSTRKEEEEAAADGPYCLRPRDC